MQESNCKTLKQDDLMSVYEYHFSVQLQGWLNKASNLLIIKRSVNLNDTK